MKSNSNSEWKFNEIGVWNEIKRDPYKFIDWSLASYNFGSSIKYFYKTCLHMFKWWMSISTNTHVGGLVLLKWSVIRFHITMTRKALTHQCKLLLWNTYKNCQTRGTDWNPPPQFPYCLLLFLPIFVMTKNIMM